MVFVLISGENLNTTCHLTVQNRWEMCEELTGSCQHHVKKFKRIILPTAGQFTCSSCSFFSIIPYVGPKSNFQVFFVLFCFVFVFVFFFFFLLFFFFF